MLNVKKFFFKNICLLYLIFTIFAACKLLKLFFMITYDFSCKRVRENGKVMSKFSIAYALEHLDYNTHATIIMDVLSYSELAKMFFDKLIVKKYLFGEQVHVINF